MHSNNQQHIHLFSMVYSSICKLFKLAHYRQVYQKCIALFFGNRSNRRFLCCAVAAFAETASVFGLQVSWPKTKTQNLGSGPDTIIVNGNHVDAASDFVHLGSSQSSDGRCRPDIQRRIGFASAVMSSLDNIWKNKQLSLSIKLRV